MRVVLCCSGEGAQGHPLLGSRGLSCLLTRRLRAGSEDAERLHGMDQCPWAPLQLSGAGSEPLLELHGVQAAGAGSEALARGLDHHC